MSGTERPLVVGIGSAFGDDAVGPMVAAHFADVPGVDVVEHADPSSLIGLFTGRGLVVLVDVMVRGAAPGTVEAFTPEELPHTGAFGAAGTHGVGLAEALELAGVLGGLPPRLVVVGVEVAAPPGTGSTVSPGVRAAVPQAVSAVREALGFHGSA